jgi:hypothetical protein
MQVRGKARPQEGQGTYERDQDACPPFRLEGNAMIEEIAPATDSRLRRLARKKGYSLRRSRWRCRSVDNFGGYIIVDQANGVIAGSRFDLGPSDIEAWFAE